MNREFCDIEGTSYNLASLLKIFDLLVRWLDKNSNIFLPNGALMLIYHDRIPKHHQKQPQEMAMCPLPREPRKKKKTLTFHYTGWLIGILIMISYNPYITG